MLKSRQETDKQRRIWTGVLTFIILILLGITGWLAVPVILDRIAQSNARGEMVFIPEGPSYFGTENPDFVNDYSFPPRQEIPPLRAFYMGKYKVTNYQYGQCVKYGDCTVPVDQTAFKDDAKQNYPVVNVTLFQANTYCRWLGQRLPTQYEWERAAHGPEGNYWPWSDRIKSDPAPGLANMPNLNWGGNYEPVDLKSVDSNPEGISAEGVFNLIGNVWEWTSTVIEEGKTTYDPDRKWNGSPDSFQGTIFYAQMGGGWIYYADEVAIYNPDLGVSARDDLGIRCAADGK